MYQLLVADVHLDEEQKNEYRWGLLDWLGAQEWQQLFILGDLTDKKDRHSATLVNKLVSGIVGLTNKGRRDVFILKGNHDCIDADHPFFEFLDLFPGVRYVTHAFLAPSVNVSSTKQISVAVLPYEPAISNSWEQPGFPKEADIAFLHGTVTGCVVENGSRLTGIPKEALAGFGKVWAGDIHVPQVLGNVEYVGAPYHIHFGDKFIPRVVRLKDWEYDCDLHYTTARKELVTISRDEDYEKLRAFSPGDMVKLRIILPYQIANEWRVASNKAKRICKDLGLIVDGVELITDRSVIPLDRLTANAELSDEDALHKYIELEKLDRQRGEVGVELLKSTKLE